MEDNINKIQKDFAMAKHIERFEKLKTKGTPSFLSHWTAVDYLGEGAWGRVYKAERGEGSHRQVCAIKIIEAVKNDKMNMTLDVLYDEVRTLMDLSDCPNIVNIRDCDTIDCESDGGSEICHYLALRMDCLEPISKKNVPLKKMSRSEIIELADDMCAALAYCHGQKPPIIHCDIKPDNILRDPDGSYRLGDFSEARYLRNTGSSSYGERGTPMFMAFEVIDDKDRGGDETAERADAASTRMNGVKKGEKKSEKKYDSRADIYSLGSTLYALFNNGKPPFWNEFEKSEEYRIGGEAAFNPYRLKHCRYRSVPGIRGVPRGLMQVIRRMCHYEPDERFSTIEEARKKLHAPHREQMRSRSYLHIWRKFVRSLSRIALIAAIAAAAAAAVFSVMRITEEISSYNIVSPTNVPGIDTSGTEQPPVPEGTGYERRLYRVPFSPDPIIDEDSFAYERETFTYSINTQHITKPRYWSARMLISCLENGVEDDKEYCFTIVTTDSATEITGTKNDAVAEINRIGGSSFTGIAVAEPQFRGTNACFGAYLADTYADEYFSALPDPPAEQ